WTRTDLGMALEDGSRALAFDDAQLARIDLSRGTADLPGWATAYDAESLGRLLDAYRSVSPEQLWDNLAYFLERVVPVAASAGVRMAIHPDDPPWPIFGLPRSSTDAAALARLTRIINEPVNGVTFCTGSLGARADNDLPAMIRAIGGGGQGRIHFMHCRNVLRTGEHRFHEVPHPSRFGSVDMLEIM